VRYRERPDAVLDDRAGDRQCIDLIRFTGLPLVATGFPHPVRSDTHDLFPSCEQRLLKPTRNRPTVLDRPHPLLIQATSPLDRGKMPSFLGLDLPLSAHSARSLVDRRQRVRALVRVRPDHDHCTVPSFG